MNKQRFEQFGCLFLSFFNFYDVKFTYASSKNMLFLKLGTRFSTSHNIGKEAARASSDALPVFKTTVLNVFCTRMT